MGNNEEQVSHTVNHRYVCEHCGELSEWTTSAIKGKTMEEIF